MIRKIRLIIIFCLLATPGFSQGETNSAKNPSALFDRVTKSVMAYQLDTTAAPDDKISRKIIELRNLRGGFNINEAINFKIEEDRQKNEIPKAELDKLSEFFNYGAGKKWLDNAITWIYRRNFTYTEIKQLVKFYKTAAGQKIATEFPVIMLQSLRAGEAIKRMYGQQQKK